MVTSYPCRRNECAAWLPMYPAPPTTKIDTVSPWFLDWIPAKATGRLPSSRLDSSRERNPSTACQEGLSSPGRHAICSDMPRKVQTLAFQHVRILFFFKDKVLSLNGLVARMLWPANCKCDLAYPFHPRR